MRRALAALALAAALAAPAIAQDRPLQVGGAAPLHSVSDEAFAAIAQFYEYDREIPLDASVPTATSPS